jgi:hypothetical protein
MLMIPKFHRPGSELQRVRSTTTGIVSGIDLLLQDKVFLELCPVSSLEDVANC